MATSIPSRGFQAYNSYNYQSRPPSIKKTLPTASIDESLVFSGIPYSSIRTSIGTVPSLPASPGGILKPIQKRRSSAMSLNNLLSRRKSLQTTAIATRRQSLWMNISKNAPTTDDTQTSIFPFGEEPPSLMRKKILRLILVFSYLLSISLLAIALATFYGVFWSGYSTTKTTNVLDVKTTVRSLVSLTSNSTFVDPHSGIEYVT
jgi:hypothetical protein